MENFPRPEATEIDGFYQNLGQEIRAARERLGMTQEQLAVALQLTRTSVTNIEKGRQRILVHTLVSLASLLKIRPEHLLPDSPRETTDLAHLEPAARQWIEETKAVSG